MMKNWKIGKRIGAGFGAVLCILLAIGGFALVQLKVIGGGAWDLTDNVMPSLQVVNEISIRTGQSYAACVDHMTDADGVERPENERRVVSLRRANEEGFRVYEPMIVDQRDRDTWAASKQAHEAYANAVDEVMTLSKAGKTQEALDKKDVLLRPAFSAVQKALAEQVDYCLLYTSRCV